MRKSMKVCLNIIHMYLTHKFWMRISSVLADNFNVKFSFEIYVN